MTIRTKAVYDGEVLRPLDPISLPENTQVALTIETAGKTKGQPYGFLKAAMEANLEGPEDWSSNLNDYLYPDPGK